MEELFLFFFHFYKCVHIRLADEKKDEMVRIWFDQIFPEESNQQAVRFFLNPGNVNMIVMKSTAVKKKHRKGNEWC